MRLVANLDITIDGKLKTNVGQRAKLVAIDHFDRVVEPFRDQAAFNICIMEKPDDRLTKIHRKRIEPQNLAKFLLSVPKMLREDAISLTLQNMNHH